jgi:hypothetical protein
MKKIGIMTMQRIYNYGSFLQTYGLNKNIEELGYDVQFDHTNASNNISKLDYDIHIEQKS